ncbi:hypothetical protein [Mesorhizobium sp. M0134]
MVSSIFEASYCLKSEKWPARNAPLSLMAADALAAPRSARRQRKPAKHLSTRLWKRRYLSKASRMTRMPGQPSCRTAGEPAGCFPAEPFIANGWLPRPFSPAAA